MRDKLESGSETKKLVLVIHLQTEFNLTCKDRNGEPGQPCFNHSIEKALLSYFMHYLTLSTQKENTVKSRSMHQRPHRKQGMVQY